jgi:carbon monoxide dehydrogenase subunit G
MGRTTVSRTIKAPVAKVFGAVAHIEDFEQIVPAIVKVEFLSENKTGVGARFRETRLMGKREGSTELEVTEYVPDEHMRCVADQGGTIWDTTFTTRDVGDGTVELTMVMDANAYKLAAKLFNPLIKGMVKKYIEQDMDAVKAWCEG